MSEKSIPYKSIIMRCDRINEAAFAKAGERFTVVKYHSEIKTVWTEIQKKAAGQFDAYCEAEEYFEKNFLFENSQISKRCIFLKENFWEKYVGTCFAWFSEKDKKVIPVLHWLAVISQYRKQGCAL